MSWLVLAGLTAFFESLKDIFSKKSVQSLDSLCVATALNLLTFAFLCPLLWIIPIPALNSVFWVTLLNSAVLNAIAWLLFLKAMQVSELSSITPLTTFTPLFLVLTSPLIVGEFPSFLGLIGVSLIVLGAWVMNGSDSASVWHQLRKDLGTKLALAVAFIWSFTSNLDKVGIQNSSPLFWVICAYGLISILLIPFALWRVKGQVKSLQSVRFSLVAIGFFHALTVACQMFALTLTLVAYVIAIKRTSAILGVIWGGILFKETRILKKLMGAIIMVFGVSLIAFLG